jgi:hypothetical protein
MKTGDTNTKLFEQHQSLDFMCRARGEFVWKDKIGKVRRE